MDKDGNGQVTCDEFVRSLSNQNSMNYVRLITRYYSLDVSYQ